MAKDYRVDITPTNGGFFVTITEILSGISLPGVVAFATAIVFLYVVVGCPVIIWPTLYDELYSVFETSLYFWLIVAAQVTFALVRVAALRETANPSIFVEVTLQSLFFFGVFELVQALGFHLALGTIDPEILRQSGVYGMSFLEVLVEQLSTDLSSPLSAVFLAYCGGLVPAVVTLGLHEVTDK